LTVAPWVDAHVTLVQIRGRWPTDLTVAVSGPTFLA